MAGMMPPQPRGVNGFVVFFGFIAVFVINLAFAIWGVYIVLDQFGINLSFMSNFMIALGVRLTVSGINVNSN